MTFRSDPNLTGDRLTPLGQSVESPLSRPVSGEHFHEHPNRVAYIRALQDDPLLGVCPSCRQHRASIWVTFPDSSRFAVCPGCAIPPTEIPGWMMADA